MDKSWMVEDRHTEKYINGVKGFIQFAFSHSAKGNTILCPCKKCLNCSWLEASHVLEHLVCEGFVNGYRRWEYHGEASSSLESGRDAHVQQFDEVEENDDLEEDCDELAGMMRDMRHDFGDLSDVEDEGDCREPTNESDPFKQLVGLATLAGVVTSGEYGCPKCHLLTCSRWLTNGKKTCYMDHRRILVRNHRFRTIDKAFFDGNVESRTAPEPLTGEEVDALTRNMETVFGKDPTGKQTIRKRKRGDPPQIFKRRSIWFRLPYWKDLLQPHNIDAMHIEKNVCDNIVNTLLGINGKTKDNTNSRRDLELFNIRTDLHPVPVGKDTFDLPPASYSMSPELKRLFCQVLKGAMFPHGYASDIRKNVHVKEKKIAGLKSHDCHVLLQQLFPLAVRKTLPEGVSAALIRVSRFFKKIYAPVIRISDMEKLEEEIAETLSILETIFLPSFFDMMVHLMVHLPLQVRLGGPVKYSNMFPIERFLCTLKGYVRTKSHPEGSIAEGYIFYECLNFCARYFERCETRISRLVRNDDPEPMSSSMPFFNGGGRYLAGKYTITLDRNAWLQAHRYVLFNYDNITPYLSKHLEYLSSTGQRNALQIDKIHHDEFHEWLRLHVAHLVDSGEKISEEIQTLAKGPLFVARTYSSYTINGYKFHTKSYDEGRPTQSSGVALVSKLSSSSNESRTYYGVITQILELDYDNKGNVVLFKCEWFDNRVQDKWVKVDKFGITHVNRKHLIHTGHKSSDAPFILASQATQVYYVEDPLAPDWLAVRQATNQRDLYDMFGMGDENSEQADGPTGHNLDPIETISIDLKDIPKTRTDIDGVLVSAKENPKFEKEWQGKKGQARRLAHTVMYRALEVAIPESTRVLRSQSVMHESDNEEDADNEQELEENEELGLDDQQKKKKDGRKRTRMHTVYDRGNQPPVPVSFNEKGQPNGDNASEFSNFIATLVKTHIPLGHEDWRLVPVEKKNALLTTLRKYYVVDDKLKDYVMGTSHKKWRDFKADLKKKFFKPEKTDEEILTLRVEDNRVSYDDCVWLIKFWRSEEAEKRSEQGKKNRSSQKVLHTSGSKSHARVAAKMHKEKGYAPRRDEVFVRTHISKRDETIMTAETSKVIKDIDTAIEEHPELLEKSIQQGDILSHVLGKERNGYVRCVGLGPTAGSLGIPGAQKLKSTKLQMAELEAEKAWRTNEALMDHMDYFKEDTKAQMDALMAEMAEMRSMLSQSIAGNKNFMHTSEIQPEASVGEYSTADQSIHDVDSIEAAQLIRKKKEAAQRLNNEAELQKRKEAELLHKKKEEALMQKNNEQDMQKKREIESKKKQEDLMQKKKEQDMQKKREADLKKKKEATVTQKNHQKGNEVILFNVYRDHTTPVAKATILATDRKKIVGGRELGTECCEVVVNYIIKRDAILPRPIGDVTTMGQAQGRTIAWLYKHLEVDKSKMKQASPPQEE
ncbi:hypothetical protein ACQ4PT_038316 [Festuca glaucescens]